MHQGVILANCSLQIIFLGYSSRSKGLKTLFKSILIHEEHKKGVLSCFVLKFVGSKAIDFLVCWAPERYTRCNNIITLKFEFFFYNQLYYDTNVRSTIPDILKYFYQRRQALRICLLVGHNFKWVLNGHN